MKIEWKDIPGYEGLYQISNTGEVKSLAKSWGIGGRILRSKGDTIMCQKINKYGYKDLLLGRDGKKKTFLVHRLVAIAFIPNPENKPQINHINGDKKDNRVENIEWSTLQENITHSIANNLKKVNKGNAHYNTRIKDSDVLEIRSSSLLNNDLAKIYGVSRNHIRSIKVGRKRASI